MFFSFKAIYKSQHTSDNRIFVHDYAHKFESHCLLPGVRKASLSMFFKKLYLYEMLHYKLANVCTYYLVISKNIEYCKAFQNT